MKMKVYGPALAPPSKAQIAASNWVLARVGSHGVHTPIVAATAPRSRGGGRGVPYDSTREDGQSLVILQGRMASPL